MSASAGILVDVLSKIVLTQNTISSESQLNSTNCHLNSAKTTNIAELSFRTSRSSSQQNLETDSAKSSCSPAQLDLSFDSGIGGIGVAGGEIDDGALKDLPELCTTNATTGAIVSCRGDDANTITAIGIGSGISCNAEEQMRQKLRYERLQQWRLILLALDRQKDPYRLLRERLSKIGERRFIGKGPADNHNCHACSCAIQQLDSNSFVTCSLCNKRICRSAKCSKWMPNSGGWECQICNLAKDSLTQTQSWVAEQMSFNHQKFVYPMRARSEIYIPIGDSKESSLHFESVSQVNLNSAAITAEQKLKIREYVEEVVSNLLGGSLDQVRISQLSKSENYLPSIINTNAIPQSLVASNNSQSNDIPNVNMPPEFAGVSQMRLRHMIESIIAEMLHLPSLTNGAGTSDVDHNMDAPDNEIAMTMSLEKENIGIRHRHKNYFEPKIYHDLLATAVLNKISDKEGNIRQFSESTPDLSITNIDSNFNVENQSTTSGSSVEPMSDISYTDTEQSPKISKVFGRESVLSDYIAAHTVPLPDLSAAATESEDDHASISSSILAEGTWEDNWLFKKKRSSLTTSMTGSIGMLVPAPKNDIRAQIGDKTADEISDLSEIGSDTDESSANMDSANLDPLNNRILNKQLIGGKNTKEALDELIETTSLISNTSAALNEPKYTETRNEYVVETASKIEATNPNIVNHSAQEAQMISVNPEKRGEQNPLSGSIAEREYKKWNNAVEMPNNPYAPEALKRRISGSQERFMDLPNINLSTDNNPISLIKTTRAEEEVKGECCSDIDYKRYSRDYYINDDKGPKTSPKRQVVTNDSYRLHPNVSDDPMEDIAINEVNSNSKNANKSIPLYNDHTDCHWTLSTPVHRSSSLKFINRRSPSKSHYKFTAENATFTSPFNYQAQIPSRPFTSTSHYDHLDRIHLQNSCYNDSPRSSNRLRNINRHSYYEIGSRLDADDNNDINDYNGMDFHNDDIQHSWRSASAAGNYPATLPKRRTLSSLSFQSSVSGASCNSSASKTSTLPNTNILSQFEKQLLHKDLKRNSFRAVSATTKDFVMNPLYERDNRNYIADDNENVPNLSAKRGSDEQMDSGVDSCLNGFIETDVKSDNTSWQY